MVMNNQENKLKVKHLAQEIETNKAKRRNNSSLQCITLHYPSNDTRKGYL